MNNVIEAEYREITALEEYSTDRLAAEANNLYHQAEGMANASLMMLAEAGKRLVIIKEKKEYGDWMQWCDHNLSFSYKKAQRIIKLAENIDSKIGVFEDWTTLSNVGISKVWALLEAPEDVQKEVLENPEMEDATVREFKEEIKRLKQEKEVADEKRIEAEKRMDFEIEKFQDELERTSELEEQIKVLTEEKTRIEQRLEEVQAHSTDKLEEDLARMAETAERNHEAAMKEAEKVEKLLKEKKRVEEALEQAKEDLKKQPEKVIDEEAISRAVEEEKLKSAAHVNTLIDEKKNLEARIARMQKETDKDSIIFAQMYKQFRKQFTDIVDFIDSMDNEKKEKMHSALKIKLQELEELA